MTSLDRPSATPSAPPRSDGEPEVFGALGPVLVATFLLWLLVLAAVGSTV